MVYVLNFSLLMDFSSFILEVFSRIFSFSDKVFSSNRTFQFLVFFFCVPLNLKYDGVFSSSAFYRHFLDSCVIVQDLSINFFLVPLFGRFLPLFF